MTRVVRLLTIVLLVLGCVGTYAAEAWRDSLRLSPKEAAWLTKRLESIPVLTQEPLFRGTRKEIPPDVVELSGADYYAAIDYRTSDGSLVHMHIGAAARTEGWLHEPTICLPVHGWNTTDSALVPIWDGLTDTREKARVRRMTFQKSGRRMLVYYWFHYGDEVITSRRERRWLRYRDLLAGRKDRPVQIVILYAPMLQDGNDAEERVESLVRALWPSLSTLCIPGETDGPSP